MKGLMKLDSLREEMPLVHDWLKYAQATRRLVLDHYSQYSGEELLEIIIAENILTQIENLRTYPVIRSKLYQRQLNIYAWIYQIETGEVLAYDPQKHGYVLIHSQPTQSGIDEIAISPLANGNGDYSTKTQPEASQPSEELAVRIDQGFPMTSLSPEQMERIYRGSRAKK
jgi:carbonic anhydrase